ncbi:N4 gp33-like protein [Burkholderia phage vB_BpP_HN05]
MEVNRPETLITHAVLGGGQSQEFGISNSAEFFQILSSTLYTDQKGAVVREVLCNAWDAHIAAGKTDMPIELTLNREEFIIRDFGTGIADADIGPIYTVYGNSTKKNDGEQTGGFGLGCKAPFAYTDHFKVTSIHNGIKSIYTMSKSAGTVGGKPGCTRIMQAPTDEPSGLEVRIPINASADTVEFKNNIIKFVRNGEMLARLNGNTEVLDTLPFSTMKHGFLITDVDIGFTDAIQVRYGNVIYPIPDHEQYALQFKQVRALLEKFGKRDYYNRDIFRIILQAPPHSIAVTPSRESLSMQAHTINSLQRLLDDFLSTVCVDVKEYAYKTMREAIASAVAKGSYKELLSDAQKIPGLNADTLARNKFVVDTESISKHVVYHNYPDYDGFRKEEVKLRVISMIKANQVHRGLAQTWLDAYDAEPESVRKGGWYNNSHKADPKSWFQRNVVGLFRRKMAAEPELDMQRLLTYGHGNHEAARYGNTHGVTIAHMQSKTPLESLLPYLRNMVILSFSRLEIGPRLKSYEFPAGKDWEPSCCLMYVVPRSSQKKIEAARNFFTNMGCYIVDLTIRHSWEDQSVLAVEKKTVVKKPVKKGLPILADGYDSGGYLAMQLLRDKEDARRTESPEWIVRLPTMSSGGRIGKGCYDQSLGMFDETQSKLIVKLWGDVGGGCTSEKQMEAYHSKGAKTVDEFVKEKVLHSMKTNVAIRSYMKFALWRVFGSEDSRRYDNKQQVMAEFAKIVYNTPELAKEFGIVDTRTKEEKWMVSLYRHLVSNLYWIEKKFPEIKAVMDSINTISLDDGAIKLKKTLSEGSTLEFLSAEQISEAIKQKVDTARRDQAIAFMKLALKL